MVIQWSDYEGVVVCLSDHEGVCDLLIGPWRCCIFPR